MCKSGSPLSPPFFVLGDCISTSKIEMQFKLAKMTHQLRTDTVKSPITRLIRTALYGNRVI